MLDGTMIVGECPHCRNEVEVTQVWEPDGALVYGGFILECSECRQRFRFHVGRDIDMSSVARGAKVVDTYDDGILGSREEALKRHGIKEAS